MKAYPAWLRTAAAAIGAAALAAVPASAQFAPGTASPAAQQTYPSTPLPAYTPSQPAGAPYQPKASSAATGSHYPNTAIQQQRPHSYFPAVASQPTPAESPDSDRLPPPANSEPYPDNNNGLPEHYGYPTYPSGPTAGYPAYPGSHGAYGHVPDYGIGGYFDEPCHTTRWFGGVYFLYMTRDEPGYRRLTVRLDHDIIPEYPYYPPAHTTVNDLRCDDLDPRFREGLEVRIGSTFHLAGKSHLGYGKHCDPCPQTYAWEFAWWGIDGDVRSQIFMNMMPDSDVRIYGMVNYTGLEYDDRPVNHYYDYQMPIREPDTPWSNGDDDDVRVIAQRVRTNFRAQNLELNFMRLPMICASPCGAFACDPCGAPGFSVTALCGVRYFRVRDDFEFATMWGTYDGGGTWQGPGFNGWTYAEPNELYHDIQMKNQLVGFQLGANMHYCIAKRWNVFWDTNFGLYNNHINHYQRIYNGGTGDVMMVEEERPAFARSRKDTVAFLGEMRLGGSYDISHKWRAVGAYRAVALSGVALSTSQIRDEYTNWADMARIDSSDSIIIHGVQVGLECIY